jgi:hypothetical protein
VRREIASGLNAAVDGAALGVAAIALCILAVWVLFSL